jgi:hypothetical protein
VAVHPSTDRGRRPDCGKQYLIDFSDLAANYRWVGIDNDD